MRCAKCGSENRDRRKFCGDCGAPLASNCPRCGASNEPGEKFCGDCGAALGAGSGASQRKSDVSSTPASSISSLEASEGERKTVTALFADIKGSMDLMEDLDPEEARAIVDPALKLMMDAAQHYGGYIVQSTGDGIFALFGAPIAHEDHPQRALFAALRLQDQLKRYSDTLRSKGRLPLQARVGLNTGEVVVRSLSTGEGHTETTPIGHAVSLAARMQVLAPVGSIAATDTTRKLGEGYFTFKPLGPAVVKGVSEPVEVFEVTGLGALRTRLQRSASRGYTKFVGREREMEALAHAAELARQGHGQIVAAVAEPGVGKSRLVYEFKARNQSGWMVLEAVSFSHGKATAYLPVIDLLRSYFHIEDDDDDRRRREKVAGRIAMLDRAQEDALPLLFGLLGLVEGADPLAGMNAQIRRQRTLEALKRILLSESLNQPLMVIFEDLHWIDEETQAFLNVLADSIATAKILLLVNYRPEYSHHWNSKTYYTQLRLDPLGKESAGEMLDALLGVGAQAADGEMAALKRLIIEKTEGTPLFMEEICQSLIEEGALVRNGAVKLTRPVDALKIPPTVQDILASRIDRLPAAEKELLQTLAVIGMEFPFALAREVVRKPEDELNRMLDGLQLAEFVYEQPAAGDTEYTFKHALTQEVAYKSVLNERRKALHERIGGAMEELYADRIEEHAADLARHYERSDNRAKAAQYLHLAGTQARELVVLVEARDFARRGLAAAEGIEPGRERDRLEAQLQLLHGASLAPSLSPSSPEVGDAFSRAAELGERLGDARFLAGALLALCTHYSVKSEFKKTAELGRQLLELAEKESDPAVLVASVAVHAFTCQTSGNLGEARRYGERCLSLPETGDVFGYARPREAWGVPGLSASLWALGFPEQAAKVASEAISKARTGENPTGIALSLVRGAVALFYLRDAAAARRDTEEAIRVASEFGIDAVGAWARIFHGWSLVEAGATGEGVREIRTGLEQRQAGAARTRPSWVAVLAEAYLKTQERERGLELIEELFVGVEQTGERFYAPELHRLRGDLLLVGNPDEPRAERDFRTAIELARAMSAKSMELRATMSLARLLAHQGKRDEARVIVSEIYSWFTEGFDTADLKDAKSLLDELASKH